jgi:hypothetical protein
MQALKFDIRHPDGRLEEIRIDGDRALLGSGAHCEIRLPVDQAAIEHVLIQANPAGVFAEARSFQPAPTINGGQFTRSQLVPGSVLGIGYTQIVVSVVELAGQATQAADKENKISPMTLLMAAIIVPVGCYVIFFTDPPDSGDATPPREVPELWGEAVASCPQQGRDQALAIAEDRFAVGLSKQERRPFHVKDGVAAVPLFETAAVCFKTAGEAEASKEAGARAAKLRVEIAEDFRTHRVRLEYAVSRKNWETAQTEVRVLLNFLEGQQHDYVNWLSSMERKLRLKYGDDKRKKKKK